MAATPQPPSLQLPKPVQNLTAARVGNQVSLHWMAPKETTDKLKIKGPVEMRICRESSSQASTAPCETVGTVTASPGKPAEYLDTLPATLTAGAFRVMTYTVLGVNKHGRNAGPSNVAHTLAGTAPATVETLSAETVKHGVVLRWQAVADLQPDTTIRLQRTLLSPSHSTGKTPGGLPAASETVEQTLELLPLAQNKDPGTALDSSAAFNRKYQYAADRVAGLKFGTEQVQVASAPSAAAIIFTRDTFPPSAPIGLAAVPLSPAINDGKPEVDLSWSINTEPDVAQYLVYRRNAGAESSSTNTPASQQIAPDHPTAPIVAPAFRDMSVQTGRTYAYSVVAVDGAGNRSPQSAEVVVTVPSH